MACLQCFWLRRSFRRAPHPSCDNQCDERTGDLQEGVIQVWTTGYDIPIEFNSIQAHMAELGHFASGFEGARHQSCAPIRNTDRGSVNPVLMSADLAFADAGSISGYRFSSAASTTSHTGAPIPYRPQSTVTPTCSLSSMPSHRAV